MHCVYIFCHALYIADYRGNIIYPGYTNRSYLPQLEPLLPEQLAPFEPSHFALSPQLQLGFEAQQPDLSLDAIFEQPEAIRPIKHAIINNLIVDFI
jgi:hypothetical protein